MARKKKEKKEKVNTLFHLWGIGTLSLREYEEKVKGWKYGENSEIKSEITTRS